jgi:hypothetical protein
VSVESSLNVVDYKEPAIMGTIVSFNCAQPEEVLIGPSTATCMEDGQWAPNPDQLQRTCKGIETFINIALVCDFVLKSSEFIP